MSEEPESQAAPAPDTPRGELSGTVGAALLAVGGVGPARTPEQLRDLLERALFSISPDEVGMLVGEPPSNLITIKDLLTLSLADNLVAFKRPEEARDARRLYRRLNSIRSRSPMYWAIAKNNLALAELQCGERDRPAALARAAAAYRAALEVWTSDTDAENWAGATVGLAEMLADPSIGEPAKCVDEAVDMLREAVKTAGDRFSDVLRAKLVATLGSVLVRRGARRSITDVEEAIACKRQACALFDAQANKRHKIDQMMDLGVALSKRAEMLGTGSQEAKEALEAALAQCDRAAEPEQWASVAGNFAIALKEAADATNDDVRRAIELLRDVIQIQQHAGAWWAWAGNQNNLANALLSVSGEDPVASIDEAASAYEAALTVWTRQAHPLEWALTTARLARADSDRAVLTGRADLHQMALARFDAALSLLSPDRNPLDWVRVMNHRAGALLEAARQQPDPTEMMQAALAAYEAAASVTRELSPPQWAQIRHNVGNLHRNLGRLTSDSREFALAAQAYNDALAARPREVDQIEWAQTSASLAEIFCRVGRAERVYKYRMQAGAGEADRIEWERLSAAFAGIHPLDDLLDEGLRCFSEALDIAMRAGTGKDIRNIAVGLGGVLADLDLWDDAAVAYEIAVDAAEQQYLSAMLRGSREIVLADLSALARTAAYARARAGDAAAAANMLERARARLLGEALELDAGALLDFIGDDPKRGPALLAAAEALQRADTASVRLLAETEALGPDEERYRRRAEHELRERRLAAKAAFEAAMSELREKADRQHADVDPGVPVAYLLVTQHGSLILLWTDETVRQIEVATFTTSSLEDLLGDGFGPTHGTSSPAGAWGHAERSALETVLARAMTAIGAALCAPLASMLRGLPAQAVALVACGRLALLPLHAAPYAVGAATSCLADEVTVGYAPSLAVLRAATAAAARRATDAREIVAVLDPRGDLPFAAQELLGIGDRLGDRCRTLPGRAASRSAVFAAIKPATHIHFACHGRTIADHPLDSHLVLAEDERISLLDLFTAGAGALPSAQLVVASACETAVIGDKAIPDEVIGLPAGFLQLGVPGFVGTLWPVGDLSSALLMTRFYELVLPENGADARLPAVALRQAQIWLRDLDGGGLSAFLSSHPRLAQDSGAFAVLAERYPERRWFAALSVWSAHVYVGALQAA